MKVAALVGLAFCVLACAPPERPACQPDPPVGTLGSICGFDHPEDLEPLPRAGIVLASGFAPGAGIWAIAAEDLERPDPRPWRIWPGTEPAPASGDLGDRACSAPPETDRFLAHGLGVQAGPEPGDALVAVVGHGAREAIELFTLHGAGGHAVLRWRGCVPLPADAMANDVAIAPDGEIVTTKFMPRRQGIAMRVQALRASVGFESGAVLAWRADRGWREIAGTRGAGPNGMVLSDDGELVYFAENGRQRIVRVPRAGVSPAYPAAYAELPSNVDNISWADGRLLAVVHLGGARALFQDCLMHWAVYEVDPDSLEVREILDHEGETVCGATSVAKVGERLLIGSMNEARIGVWRASP